MLSDAPGLRTQREELKIRVSPVRFRPWPLTANTVEKKRREKTSSKDVGKSRPPLLDVFAGRLYSTQLV
jgi:hypothetical protein